MASSSFFYFPLGWLYNNTGGEYMLAEAKAKVVKSCKNVGSLIIGYLYKDLQIPLENHRLISIIAI